jgi:hypothetical protein
LNPWGMSSSWTKTWLSAAPWPHGMGNLNQYMYKHIYIYHIPDISHFWLRLELVQSSYNYILITNNTFYLSNWLTLPGILQRPTAFFSTPPALNLHASLRSSP